MILANSREAIVELSCWPALKLRGGFLVACTKVKNRDSVIGFRRKVKERRALDSSVILAMAQAS